MRIRSGPRKTESVDGYIHSIESLGTVDGPGVRFVIFTQGCPHRCLYCHNPDTWRLKAGRLVASGELLDQIESTSGFLKRAGGGDKTTLWLSVDMPDAQAARFEDRSVEQVGESD